MREVIVSALFGLFKGAAAESPEDASPYDVFRSVVAAPVTEELLFREGGTRIWKGTGIRPGRPMPLAVTAVPFAVAHLRPDMDSRRMLARFVDAFLGGLLYQSAYDRGGIKMSIAAHAAHNLGVHLGCMFGGKNQPEQERLDGLPERQVLRQPRSLEELSRQLRQDFQKGARR